MANSTTNTQETRQFPLPSIKISPEFKLTMQQCRIHC